MKKTDLKSIIKECLIEILQEGLLTTSYKIQENKKRNPSLKETLTEEVFLPRANHPAQHKFANKPQPRQDTRKFENNIKQKVSQLTNDPIMASLFEDTAKGSLQDMLNHEIPGGAGGQQIPADLMDSTSSAGAGISLNAFEGNSSWADIAFASKK